MKLNQPFFIEKRENSFSLDGEWEFLWLDTSEEDITKLDFGHKAQLPASVYHTLWKSDVLPHPYYGTNSNEYHWVDKKVWYYKKEFFAESDKYSKDAYLAFDGIGYYSKVWLNGQLLGDHEGMFGGPCVKINDCIRYGETNQLVVEVKSANYGKKNTFEFWNHKGGNRDLFHKEFNGAVREADMKWGYYYPDQALEAFENAYNNGVRYFRGHSIIFEKLVSAKGSNLIPKECGIAIENKDKAMLDKLIKDHMNDIMPRFDKYTTDWDVENEMISNSLFREAFGDEYLKEIYQWAREADPDGILYYNEAIMFDPRFKQMLDMVHEMGVDIDAIGLQSHIDDGDKSFREIEEIYDYIASKGYRIKVTEYSSGNYEDELLRASYTRDFLIHAFSHEAMDGVYIWGFQDGKTYAKFSLFLDKDGNRKPTLDQWEDLIYNKWWTKDAKAKTDAEGKATIRGFYGDYDVTVRHNGKEKAVMAAYHKGYNNTLEIVID